MTRLDEPRGLKIRQDATARLLLLTSRPDLSGPQLEEAEALASRITNWPIFIDIATRKFSVTYAHKALSRIRRDAIPEQYREKMRNAARMTGLRTLKVAAAQVSFHKSCIQPNEAQHAYVKGPALSLQHGRNFTERNCRDIDILIASHSFENVALAAWKNGYRVALSIDPAKFAKSARDVKFLARFTDEVKIFSDDDIVIELHRRLDKRSKVFNTKEALANVETVELSGVRMNTLSPPLHFVYICYHHARHMWSHLHWLADLDLMISAGCSREESLEFAHQKGIKPTVEAAFAFHELISRPGQWSETKLNAGLEYDFLKGCLANLDGGLELEYALKEGRYLHDFNLASQVSEAQRHAFTKTHWTEDFRPSLTQYMKRPYPTYMFWLYRIERAIIGVRDLVKRTLGIPVGYSAADSDASSNPDDDGSVR